MGLSKSLEGKKITMAHKVKSTDAIQKLPELENCCKVISGLNIVLVTHVCLSHDSNVFISAHLGLPLGGSIFLMSLNQQGKLNLPQEIIFASSQNSGNVSSW